MELYWNILGGFLGDIRAGGGGWCLTRSDLLLPRSVR